MRKIYIVIVLSTLLIMATVIIAQTRRTLEEEFIKKIIDIEEMQTLNSTIRACDVDGDSIIIIINDIPDGATLSDAYFLPYIPDPCECNNEPNCIECFQNSDIVSWYGADLQWTPSYEQEGNYSLHIHAIDNKGADDWVVYIINVANKNRSPVL